MRNVLAIVSLCFLFQTGLAQSPSAWKTLQNQNGYEVKFPGCWHLEIGDPYENGPFEVIYTIAIRKGNSCGGAKIDEKKASAGISIWPTEHKHYSKEELEKRIKYLKHWTNSGDALKGKVVQVGDATGVQWVEKFNSNPIDLRWKMELFCPGVTLLIVGPGAYSVDPAFVEKLKKEELVIPEPERAIYESIRCLSAEEISKIKKQYEIKKKK